MQKNSNVAIALISFVLLVTMVSMTLVNVSFAQNEYPVPIEPNDFQVATGPAGHPLASDPQKRSFYNPLPAWQLYQTYTGPYPAPSPWYTYNQRFNQSGCNYNDACAPPRTAHIRWMYQYGSGGVHYIEEQWGLNFRQGPRDQMSDPAAWFIGYGGYVVFGISEGGGERLMAVDEWNGERVWEVKMVNGSSPSWILNSGGGPTLYTTGRTVLGYGLMTGNLVDVRTYPISVSMYYNSSKFANLEIGETELYAPGGVVYGSGAGGYNCYSWSNPDQKIWGPTWTPVNPNCLVETADGGAVLCGSSQQTGTAAGIDAITGELLWTTAQTGGSQDSQAGGYGMYYVPMWDGSIHAFNARTGDLVWVNKNISASYWNEFRMNVGDGAVINCNRDGNIYCLDAFTGELRWSFFAGPCPYEPYKSYYGCYGFHIAGIGGGTPATGGGVYFAANGDESIGTVSSLPGSMMYAVDMETGELLYKFPSAAISHDQTGIVMDGNAFIYNPVTAQLMCFGKGDTKLELGLTAAQVNAGGSTTITGRITDLSAATNGRAVPAVSKESMEAYMTYLYGGYPQPPPGLITGVTVQLYAVDTANNVIDLGNVTSDSEGYFSMRWTPPNAAEKYQITASFSEDESYYSSWATTVLAVEPAVGSATTSAATTPSTASSTAMTTIVLAAIVVVSISVNVAVLLRTRGQKRGKQQ